MEIVYQSIGTIRTPYKTTEGMPIQPQGAVGTQGHIDLNAELAPGLKSLSGFSHLVLLYHFHAHPDASYKLEVVPFLDDRPHGLFSTRAPRRPNPIGLSVVRLIRIAENRLYIDNVDVLDQTPLLDIKPHVPAFDATTEVRLGWMETKLGCVDSHRSDNRFKD